MCFPTIYNSSNQKTYKYTDSKIKNINYPFYVKKPEGNPRAPPEILIIHNLSSQSLQIKS